MIAQQVSSKGCCRQGRRLVGCGVQSLDRGEAGEDKRAMRAALARLLAYIGSAIVPLEGDVAQHGVWELLAS